MAVKGEGCPLVGFCEQYTNPNKVSVIDCNYKSSQELCFKGLVFDVGAETMDRLRAVRKELSEQPRETK